MHRRPVAVTARAYAKLNLDLRVLGVREDGFHNLRTVFQAIALHDTIECVPRTGPFEIECSTPAVPVDESNLIWRAADALWRSLGRDGPVRDVMVRLDKQIPLQAGLGGGSADAAATLTALARAWRVAVVWDQLSDLAATLGADVPFFLSGGTALGLGRGDEIYLLADWPRHWVVLLVPDFGVSSRQAYEWFDARDDLRRDVSEREPPDVPGPWSSRTVRMMNDLEGAIAERHPEIDRMKAALRSAGALASAMSGSGSTVFGLFQQHSEALAARERLSESGHRVILTESLSRREYTRYSRPVAIPRSSASAAASKDGTVATNPATKVD